MTTVLAYTSPARGHLNPMMGPLLELHREVYGDGHAGGIKMLARLGVVTLQPLVGPSLARHDGARLIAASSLLIGAGFGVYALAGWLPPLPRRSRSPRWSRCRSRTSPNPSWSARARSSPT